jgi:hypothetical protein
MTEINKTKIGIADFNKLKNYVGSEIAIIFIKDNKEGDMYATLRGVDDFKSISIGDGRKLQFIENGFAIKAVYLLDSKKELGMRIYYNSLLAMYNSRFGYNLPTQPEEIGQLRKMSFGDSSEILRT